MGDEPSNLEKVVNRSGLTHGQLERVIKRVKQPQRISLPVEVGTFSQKSVTFLIVGDLHLNAKEPVKKKKANLLCDFKRFREVLHIGKEEGAQYVLQTGDVVDGENMRPEQKYSLVVQGLDNVVEYAANVWPNIGLRTFFIGGNHDQTYMKIIGADVCRAIAAKRPDLIYLGMNEGNLPLQPQYIDKLMKGETLPAQGPTWLRILHPAKGTPKSQSYQPQAETEGLSSDVKPNILIIGHYHKMDYMFSRNVHAFQAGTMEKQSDWMRRKILAAQLGAWLVTAFYKEDGTIDLLRARKLCYEVNGDEKWGFLDERGVYEGT